MSILTDIQGDTSNVLSDWDEAITFYRCTAEVSTAGEGISTWSTSLVTIGDVQAVEGGRRGESAVPGYEWAPDFKVFMRKGIDVQAGDRFKHEGLTLYVQRLRYDEDKLVVYASRRMKDATL